MMKKILLFSLAPSTLFANVNMKTGALMVSEIDLQEKNGIHIERYYHSRSLREGLLGVGWCLTIENKIEINEHDTLSLFDCREGKKLLFHKTSPSRWALGNQTISKQGGQYLRQFEAPARGSISSEHYSLDGKLKRPKDLTVSRTKSELVLATKNEVVTYHLPMNRLMSVAKGAGLRKIRTDEFTYDQFLNLTQTKKLRVKYDWANDRVSSITRNGCQESYTYTMEQNSKKVQFHSEVSKSCPQHTTKVQRFEFEYEQSGGAYSLRKYQTFNTPRLSLERNP